jgi:serine protease AprX
MHLFIYTFGKFNFIMKSFLLFLLVPFFCLSQTPAERQKIISTYNQAEIAALKSEHQAYMAEQKRLVDQYIAEHPEYKESETHSLQRVINGVPIFYTIFNQGSSQTIRANRLYPGGSLGLNVTGDGMIAGVWDGGKVRNTHTELNNKVTLGDDADELSPHATHVTGTVLATGVSAAKRGIAYGADGITYDWDNDTSEMIDFGNGGYLVSNHSYGYSTDNLTDAAFGAYDGSSIEIDEIARNFPYYQIVIAAGNDRNNPDLNQSSAEGGYDLLSGTGVAKNAITVAAVNELQNYTGPESVMMSEFSNFGPPDDGRIKPDISAKGVDTNSCVSTGNNAYAVYSGTSMAAPAITGMIVLLQKHYSNVNGSNYMKAATVRGLICHSAKEAGFNQGPDYEYGWGLADTESAANVISQSGSLSLIEENTLSLGQVYTKQFLVATPQAMKATICWTDPKGSSTSGNDVRTPRLKNNLDLKILKDGVTYYPWRLEVEDPVAAATRSGDNDVDNVERVDIDIAEPGVYTIQVSHKGTVLTGGPQEYSLILSGEAGLTLGTDTADFTDKIILYPNPARNTLNFATPNNAEISSIALYDVVGKQVQANSQVQQNTLDISNLSRGVYFAKFIFGGSLMVKKFVKE